MATLCSFLMFGFRCRTEFRNELRSCIKIWKTYRINWKQFKHSSANTRIITLGWKWKCQLLSRVQPFVTPSTVASRLPCPWDSPGRSTGVGCHFLLQGIFPTQGLNPGLLHCRQILYHWVGSLLNITVKLFIYKHETHLTTKFINFGPNVLCLVAQSCPTLGPHGL